MNSIGARLLVTSIALGLFTGFAGCGPTDTADIHSSVPTDEMSYGPATATPPPEAKTITADAFLDLWLKNDFRLVQPSTTLTMLGIDVGSAISATSSVTISGRDGQARTYKLLSDAEKQNAVASAALVFPTAENHARIYSYLHAALDAGVAARYPSPEQARLLGASELKSLTRELSAQVLASPPTGQGAGGLLGSLQGPRCDGDEGRGQGSDYSAYGTSCDALSAVGLYANYSFPLKAHVSCVKDQANRGTCGSFAIVASLETEISLKLGRKVNLSEQDLYSHVKNDWWPTFYGDGLGDDGVWKQMISTNYVVPFESLWDYNPSNSRTEDDKTSTYTHSCDSYSEACTDTASQAGLYCATWNDKLWCGFSSPYNAEGYGFRATGESQLWDSFDLDGTVSRMRATLSAGKAITLGIDVPPTFDSPTNGYVSYVDPDGKSRGGHLVEVVGSIDNTTLASLLPKAVAGAGGGYFIIKNSWSVCYGDGGFGYLPFSWVKAHAWSATVLDSLVAI